MERLIRESKKQIASTREMIEHLRKSKEAADREIAECRKFLAREEAFLKKHYCS